MRTSTFSCSTSLRALRVDAVASERHQLNDADFLTVNFADVGLAAAKPFAVRIPIEDTGPLKPVTKPMTISACAGAP